MINNLPRDIIRHEIFSYLTPSDNIALFQSGVLSEYGTEIKKKALKSIASQAAIRRRNFHLHHAIKVMTDKSILKKKRLNACYSINHFLIFDLSERLKFMNKEAEQGFEQYMSELVEISEDGIELELVDETALSLNTMFDYHMKTFIQPELDSFLDSCNMRRSISYDLLKYLSFKSIVTDHNEKLEIRYRALYRFLDFVFHDRYYMYLPNIKALDFYGNFQNDLFRAEISDHWKLLEKYIPSVLSIFDGAVDFIEKFDYELDLDDYED